MQSHMRKRLNLFLSSTLWLRWRVIDALTSWDDWKMDYCGVKISSSFLEVSGFCPIPAVWWSVVVVCEKISRKKKIWLCRAPSSFLFICVRIGRSRMMLMMMTLIWLEGSVHHPSWKGLGIRCRFSFLLLFLTVWVVSFLSSLFFFQLLLGTKKVARPNLGKRPRVEKYSEKRQWLR